MSQVYHGPSEQAIRKKKDADERICTLIYRCKTHAGHTHAIMRERHLQAGYVVQYLLRQRQREFYGEALSFFFCGDRAVMQPDHFLDTF